MVEHPQLVCGVLTSMQSMLLLLVSFNYCVVLHTYFVFYSDDNVVCKIIAPLTNADPKYTGFLCSSISFFAVGRPKAELPHKSM